MAAVCPEPNTHQLVMEGEVRKAFALNGQDLSHVSPALLAGLLTSVQEVRLQNTELSKEQLDAFFLAISFGSSSPLWYLNLESIDLSQADHVLFSNVNNVSYADLTDTSLTGDQLQNLFTAMNEGTELEHLDLYGNDMSGVEPSLLVELAQVEEVTICDTNLNKNQIETLFTAVLHEDSDITQLFVYGLDLSCIDLELLRKVIYKLKNKNDFIFDDGSFCNTNMSMEEIYKIIFN